MRDLSGRRLKPGRQASLGSAEPEAAFGRERLRQRLRLAEHERQRTTADILRMSVPPSDVSPAISESVCERPRAC